jgi:hypothetical protein
MAALLRPLQILHRLLWDWIRDSTMKRRRLTPWAVATQVINKKTVKRIQIVFQNSNAILTYLLDPETCRTHLQDWGVNLREQGSWSCSISDLHPGMLGSTLPATPTILTQVSSFFINPYKQIPGHPLPPTFLPIHYSPLPSHRARIVSGTADVAK